MNKRPNIITKAPLVFLGRFVSMALLMGIFAGCASSEKLYKQTISDTIIEDYKKKIGAPDVVFYEYEPYRVYTAGEIRELIAPERNSENNEIPLDVITRLAGIPENRQELVSEPVNLTQEQVYDACRIHLKGIHNKKKLIRVIRCSYLVDFEPPYWAMFDKYFYLSADGKTCYGTRIISRW